MIKHLLLSLVLGLAIFQPAQAEVWTLNQVLETICRVQAGDIYGSGSCVDYRNGKYYALTNAHVVGNNQIVKVEFFKNGKKTLPIPAKVVNKFYQGKTEIDFAILEIDEKYFGKYPPRVAQLAPKGAMAIGGYVVSAGCPGARWPSAWEGFLVGNDGKLAFYPPPLGGQSGSGLYIVVKEDNEYNTYLKGVITWRKGDGPGSLTNGYENAHGVATSIDNLFNIFDNQKVSTDLIIPDDYEQIIFKRLLPIPEDNPAPPEDNPAPAPDSNITPENPYGDIPEFLRPPVEKEKEKPKEEPKKEIEEYNVFGWLATIGAFLSSVFHYYWGKGKVRLKFWAPKVIDILENKVDKAQDKILPEGKLRELFEQMEASILNKVKSEIVSKIEVQPQDDNPILDEVARTVVDNLDVNNLKNKLNQRVGNLLKSN